MVNTIRCSYYQWFSGIHEFSRRQIPIHIHAKSCKARKCGQHGWWWLIGGQQWGLILVNGGDSDGDSDG